MGMLEYDFLSDGFSPPSCAPVSPNVMNHITAIISFSDGRLPKPPYCFLYSAFVGGELIIYAMRVNVVELCKAA
jgi:hypothetical protein